MYQQEDQSGRAPFELCYYLHKQQDRLLRRIDGLSRGNNGSEAENIRILKQEYNRLVEKRAIISRNPRSDPLEVLPPELWPDIFKEVLNGAHSPIEALLVLTLVSRRWCVSLTALPVLWTHVRLNHEEADYLEKAAICIQLSGEYEIDLHIFHLTLDEWGEISSTIKPAGSRIRRLSFEIGSIELLVARQIIEDFAGLPVLRDLVLPEGLYQASDEQDVHALVMKKMPSIKAVKMTERDLQSDIWNRFIISRRLRGEEITKASLEALTRLPNLQHLHLKESIGTSSLTLPSSSLASLIHFTYLGPASDHRLPWIGNNLASLTISSPKDLNAILLAVSRFPHLRHLRVDISSPSLRLHTQNSAHPQNSQNSIRSLTFRDPGERGQNAAGWEVLLDMFFVASPHLEALTVHGASLTDSSWNSIRSIRNLRDLTVKRCNYRGYCTSIPLNVVSLRNLQWSGPSLEYFTAQVQSYFLQSLFVELGSHHVDGVNIVAPYFVMSRNSFPNVTSLVISTADSLTWELGSWFRLRELEMRAPSSIRYSLHWASDVLEAILMRPCDTPALEKITLVGDFVEWDILLLMLERRNFLNRPGISPIRTLVVDDDLPYRLLYPLSELLGGRFVERDPNSFSIEAIGKQVWDQSLTGCIHCHYAFRECETLLMDTTRITGCDLPPGLGKNYSLPSDHLIADPPLTPDVAFWLSRKNERRDAFVRRYREFQPLFRRMLYCYDVLPYDKVTITGDTLVGAHFRDEQDDREL